MTEFTVQIFLGKESIDNPAEVLFLLYIDEELRKRGYSLDLGENTLDLSFKDAPLIHAEIQRRVYNGEIKGTLEVKEEFFRSKEAVTRTLMNTSDKVRNKGISFYFQENVSENVREWEDSRLTLSEKSELHSILLHCIANHFIDALESGQTPSTLKGYIDVEAASFQKELFFIIKEIPFCKKYMQVTFHRLLPSSDKVISENNLSLTLYVYKLFYTGGFKTLSIVEKQKIAEETLKVGGIYALWVRDKVSVSNPVGQIVNVKIVRIDKIDSRGVQFTSLPVNMTYEDTAFRMSQQIPEVQSNFLDMLDLKKDEQKEWENYSSLALGEYLGEELLIVKELSEEKSNHFIWMQDRLQLHEFTDQEVAFYAINQKGYSIDNQLFVEMYGLDESWLDLIQGTDFQKQLSQIKNWYNTTIGGM